jgi:hypothetical protein
MVPLLGYELDATDGALASGPVFLSVGRDLLAPGAATEWRRAFESRGMPLCYAKGSLSMIEETPEDF